MKEDRNWWLWTANLKTGGEERFVYALLAPTREGATVYAPEHQKIEGDAKLVFREIVLDSEAGSRIVQALADGFIDLRAAGLDIEPITVRARRETIEPALGDSGAELVAHYSFPALERLRPAGAKLQAIVEALQDRLNIPFRGRMAGHLGNLDLVRFRHDPPAAIAASFDGAKAETYFIISRREPWLGQTLRGHLVLTAGPETLVDRLVGLPPGEERVQIAVPRETTAFALTIFDEVTGLRCYHETASLLTQVDLNSRLSGRSIKLSDPLTDRLKGAGRAVADAAAKRTDFSSDRSEVSTTDRSIERHLQGIQARLAAEDFNGADRFFERTLHEEWGALAHFRTLLQGGTIERAILVDPFFGEDAFLRLVMRLGSIDLDLTIVTSWGVTDPDTAARAAPGAQAALDANLDRLRRLVHRIKGIVAPRLHILNLVRGTDQAFHDRYLLLQPRAGLPTVHLLSNSINSMAMNWPFCMSALNGAAAARAKDYVEGLSRGEDITGPGSVAVNFRWSSEADEPRDG